MDQNVILYTIGCPKCRILEKKLNSAHIDYTVNDNLDEMTALGIKSAPVLCVNGKLMTFPEAVGWIGEYVSERIPSD